MRLGRVRFFQRWCDYTAAEEWFAYMSECWPWVPDEISRFFFVTLGCRVD